MSSSNGLYRTPLTHNPRVVSLEDLNRIRYGTANGIIAKGPVTLNAAPSSAPPPEPEPEPDDEHGPEPEPAESKRKRQTYDVAQRLTILAEASAPGAKIHEVCAKYGVHQTTIWEWRRLLTGQKRRNVKPSKPAKRRRVVPERRAAERPGIIHVAPAAAPFDGVDDIAETLRRVILDATKAARGVEALRAELRRMRSIFGGK